MRISDWSSDVCSSDLRIGHFQPRLAFEYLARTRHEFGRCHEKTIGIGAWQRQQAPRHFLIVTCCRIGAEMKPESGLAGGWTHLVGDMARTEILIRSEEHTSELQSLMRISYAVFCLKKKTTQR